MRPGHHTGPSAEEGKGVPGGDQQEPGGRSRRGRWYLLRGLELVPVATEQGAKVGVLGSVSLGPALCFLAFGVESA